MEVRLQDALRHFNVGKGAWYGWKDTKDGEVYSNLKLNLGCPSYHQFLYLPKQAHLALSHWALFHLLLLQPP